MRLLVALLMLCALPAFAQGTATLSCIPPVQNTDGTTISGPMTFKFYRGTALGTYPSSQTSTSCGTVFNGLGPGTHYFVATAIVGGVESAFSSPTNKIITVVQPSPPTITLKSVAGPVFTVQTTDNSLVLPQIGTVAAGVNCDPSQMVSQNGATYNRIPISSVTLLPGMSGAGVATFGLCQ